MTTPNASPVKHPFQRKMRNLVIDKRFQLKIGIYFFSLGFALVGGFSAIVVYRLNQMESSFIASSLLTGDQVLLLQGVLREIIWSILVAYLVFTVFTVIYAILISHRIAGPVIAICNFIDELKKGNYDYARPLRKYDDLQPIMQKLHQLARILKGEKKS